MTDHLCPTGWKLYDEWDQVIERHEPPETIYPAMKAYFTHKKDCPDCMQRRALATHTAKMVAE
jgi:hypothetical protein